MSQKKDTENPREARRENAPVGVEPAEVGDGTVRQLGTKKMMPGMTRVLMSRPNKDVAARRLHSGTGVGRQRVQQQDQSRKGRSHHGTVDEPAENR